MRLALLFVFLLPLHSVFASAAVDPKNEPMPTPLMRTVDPYIAKAGAEVVITGENLQSKIVSDVFISAGDKNIKLEIVTQGEKEIKLRIPADVKPGSWHVVVLVRTADPLLIEEPVRINVAE